MENRPENSNQGNKLPDRIPAEITFKVINKLNLHPAEFAKELLLAEMRMNLNSKLRFHLITDNI
jgi:hypothetical protein